MEEWKSYFPNSYNIEDNEIKQENGIIKINTNDVCYFVGDLHADMQVFIRILQKLKFIQFINEYSLEMFIQEYNIYYNDEIKLDNKMNIIINFNKLINKYFILLDNSNSRLILLGDILDGKRGKNEVELFSEFLILQLIYLINARLQKNIIIWLLGNHCIFYLIEDYSVNRQDIFDENEEYKNTYQYLTCLYMNLLNPSVIAIVNNKIYASHILIHDQLMETIDNNGNTPYEKLGIEWNNLLNILKTQFDIPIKNTEKIIEEYYERFNEYDIRSNIDLETIEWLGDNIHISGHNKVFDSIQRFNNLYFIDIQMSRAFNYQNHIIGFIEYNPIENIIIPHNYKVNININSVDELNDNLSLIKTHKGGKKKLWVKFILF
jgi:hypothetical protein